MSKNILMAALLLLSASFPGMAATANNALIQEATSFGGQPLYRYDVPAEKRAEVYERIAGLEASDAKTEDDYLTLGYLYAEVGSFQAAIDLYSRGLAQFPESFRLLRHRGHRYLNVRELEKAIADLEMALPLVEQHQRQHGVAYQYNLAGEQFGTYEHWIWYHIGLYHYLNGNYAQAAAGYQRCVETATSDIRLIGATDWLWNAYQKAKEPAKAAAALEVVSAAIETAPQHAYVQRVRVYKGLTDPQSLLDLDKPGDQWSGRDITLGYGIANWHELKGDERTAQLIYKKILEAAPWSSWAYVVTDKEQAVASASAQR